MKITKILGQPSWCFNSDCVSAAVTRDGGQLGPVTFRFPKRSITPFSVAPWAEEKSSRDLPPILRSLRGDFFCMPFGGNATPYNDEQYPVHGETANASWRLESCSEERGKTTLHLSLPSTVRAGWVDKFLQLHAGHRAIYSRHVVTEVTGPMSLGHHAMLTFPETAGSGRLTTSKFRFGQVAAAFEKPAEGGYYSLEVDAEFSSLNRVPLATGGTTDLSKYPAREGFEDLVMFVHEDEPDFAWTAVTFPEERYVWFALKDPRVLRSTILWISNGGRHYAPWNGRHRRVMGIEEVTSFFHYGLAESVRPNAFSRRGYPTYLKLDSQDPLTVNYIMGVAEIPRGFERVKSLRRDNGSVILTSNKGEKIHVPLDVSFLY